MHRFVQVVPPPPQTLGVMLPHGPDGQVPQSSAAPQPSPIVPQYRPPFIAVHDPRTHPGPPRQTPLVQTCPFGQVAQFRMPPQPSPMVPQYWVVPIVHCSRVQLALPGQRFAAPPLPQAWLSGQLPHSSARPQPSPIRPQ